MYFFEFCKEGKILTGWYGRDGVDALWWVATADFFYERNNKIIRLWTKYKSTSQSYLNASSK